MTQPTRSEGYYWVQLKRQPNKVIGEWIKYEGYEGDWYKCGREESWQDDELESIGHRIPPDEEIGKMQEAIAELLEGLREITNSEWMVTHDWGGDRDSILDKAKQLITKYSTNG